VKGPAPRHTLAAVALVVREYDEAIAFFTQALGFTLVEDTPMGDGKRWVVVAPGGPGDAGSRLLLARATTEAQREAIGRHAGGRVGFFLHTDDFDASLQRLQAGGARLTEAPRDEPYGRVVVFLDLYGNRWDLIGPRPAPGGPA
jgi:catechol 2,3-dioxygenase-like lactoylglutathione lyase family enzyme